jgi:dTDP-4-dehydrorhamnose reductase
MLGSVLMRDPGFYGTTRRDQSDGPSVLPGIDVSLRSDLRRAIEWAQPQVVINCAGIVKSECDKHSEARVFRVNGEAPHLIADAATESGCRFIHVSTDCVFDGTRGGRTETDIPDATDVYGRSKIVGEIPDRESCVTLRTSFIGRDRRYGRGLLEWLLQKDEVVGYELAIWSGFSTYELAKVIGIVVANASLNGLYNAAGPVVSKAGLLQTLIDAYRLRCFVWRTSEPHIDRSLDGSRFNKVTGYTAPSWGAMAKELALKDSQP